MPYMRTNGQLNPSRQSQVDRISDTLCSLYVQSVLNRSWHRGNWLYFFKSVMRNSRYVGAWHLREQFSDHLNGLLAGGKSKINRISIEAAWCSSWSSGSNKDLTWKVVANAVQAFLSRPKVSTASVSRSVLEYVVSDL